MFSNITSHVPQLLRSPRNLTFLGFFIAATSGLTGYLLTRKRITEEERERLRRDYLAHAGRITDGSITETHWLADTTTPSAPDTDSEDAPTTPTRAHTDTPAVLLYRYQIAGVVYECAQDVTPMPHLVRQIRIDLPIQVRFDPRNPGNSIVVAETWNGLRFQHPSGQHAIAQQPQSRTQPEKSDSTPTNAPTESQSLSHHG